MKNMWNHLNTTLFTRNVRNEKLEWFLVDVKQLKEKTVGRIAAKIANILKGKDDGSYSPHVNTNKRIIVINSKYAEFSGDKLYTKNYYKHTQQFGHLKIKKARDVFEMEPTMPLRHAINGMLKKTRQKETIKNFVYIYADENHNQTAQQPKPLEL